MSTLKNSSGSSTQQMEGTDRLFQYKARSIEQKDPSPAESHLPPNILNVGGIGDKLKTIPVEHRR